MIELHYWPPPNGHKITLFLKEAGLAYQIVPVNLGKGEQFKPEFLAISPNNRMPAIVDQSPSDGGAPISVFESGAILLYLAEKTGRFLPTAIRARIAERPATQRAYAVGETIQNQSDLTQDAEARRRLFGIGKPA